MSWTNPNTPNLPDFILFVREGMQIGTGLVPDDSLWLQWSFNRALRLVLRVPGACGPDYTEAVYNCAGHILLTITPTQPGTPFLGAVRGKFHLLDPNLGIVTGSADQGTSNSLAVPDALQNLTIGDLQFTRTPWGLAFLSFQQDFGGLFGLS